MRVLNPEQVDGVLRRIKAQGFEISTVGCWVWSGDKLKSGYGRIWANGKTRSLHRISYEIWNGEIPDGYLVRHSCDNPPCFNPEHLVLGRELENNQDMWSRGRARVPSGDTHYETKLPSSMYAEVVQAYETSGLTMKDLGAQYGVSAQTVCNIRKRYRKMLDQEAVDIEEDGSLADAA